MKTAITITLMLALTAALGCQSMSRRGGGAAKDEGFTIGVPGFGMAKTIKQGETEVVTISLSRGDHFKRDVKLDIMAAKGVTVEPTRVTVKASDGPDVALRITAPKDAALGEYTISITGTPESGERTNVDFTVKVVAP